MRTFVLFLSLASCTSTALAGGDAFTTGPVFKDYGPVADIVLTLPVSPNAVFRHSFDVSTPAEGDAPVSTFVSAARFINMHARAGVASNNIQLAVVVHGKAVLEVADENSSSADLIGKLTDHGVRIIVCGQSAAYYNVETSSLLPGVEMALSAMTAHALLQQQGYTLNPF